MRKDRSHEGDASAGTTAAAGQAALLLVESLIHELVAIGLLPVSRALAVVEIAVDTAGEIALAKSAGREDDDAVGGLLQAIACTLSLAAGDQPSPRHV